MGLLLKRILLAWTHVSMDDRDEKKRQTSISVILISTNADIHKDLISIDWGTTSNSGGVRGRGSCTALLTALAPPQCSYSELRNIVVAPVLVGLLCCCITTVGLHSMPCRGNTQGPIFSEVAIEDLTLWTVLICQKKWEADRYIHSPLYESSVPVLALKCQTVIDRKALSLQQSYTLQIKIIKKGNVTKVDLHFHICFCRANTLEYMLHLKHKHYYVK